MFYSYELYSKRCWECSECLKRYIIHKIHQYVLLLVSCYCVVAVELLCCGRSGVVAMELCCGRSGVVAMELLHCRSSGVVAMELLCCCCSGVVAMETQSHVKLRGHQRSTRTRG